MVNVTPPSRLAGRQAAGRRGHGPIRLTHLARGATFDHLPICPSVRLPRDPRAMTKMLDRRRASTLHEVALA
jgi:hypothetical protein